MLKGFKEFIMRGNVVDLAIAVVIGTAFAAVVSTFVSSIVKPIISAFPGGNSNGLGFSLRHTAGAPKGSPADALGKSTFIDISGIINALIVFLITALVVYFFFVVPMKKVQDLRARRLAAGEEPGEEVAIPSDETLLLREIRDLLADQSTPAGGSHEG